MHSDSRTGTPEILRMALPFAVESAGLDDQGVYRVSGLMNTFKITHSRRILHPQGFKNWRKRNAKATLPMLANHGFVPGFGTIGEWDQFDFIEGQGMRWSGRIGEGTEPADQARTLLNQKLLRQLSVGWVSVQQRLVRADDKDLDPHFKQAMEEAGIDQVLAFIDWYPVEGSIVDVADDPGARLAARLDGGRLDALEGEIKALRAELDKLSAAGGSADAAALIETLQRQSDEFIEQLVDTVIERLQNDECLAAAAAGFREDFEDLAELSRETASAGGADAELKRLQRRVARGARR